MARLWLGILVMLMLLPSAPASAWEPVAPVDWSAIKPSDFDDSELEVPYFLHHFHTIANAVVETGENPGFLAIKVNREPKDNEPYNARIQENTLPFAYFYTVKRRWNPYFASPALKERIEAMLQFWCRIQNPQTGLFSEYKPGGWGLAPTGFGVLAMSRTLELLGAADAPRIDQATFDQAMRCQRKAIMALLTRDDCYAMGRSCSNQHSGVYRAATAYLGMRNDPEMERALFAGAERAVRETQSPAEYMYEDSGVDVGYSSVHDTNLRLAWPLVGKFPKLEATLLGNQATWNHWLSYDLVHQPGTKFFFVNSGANSRTNFAVHLPTVRPWSNKVETSRAFAVTREEYAAQLAEKRNALEATWPKFKELVVPNAYSYQGITIFLASTDPGFYYPTNTERDSAIAKMPYLVRRQFTRMVYDPRQPTGFLFVRRPAYYAAANFGKILVRNHQCYGLGLLWNDRLGTVLQSVAGSEWMCGTVVGGQMIEKTTLKSEIRNDGVVVQPTAGGKEIEGKQVTLSYPFAQGRKTITYEADGISVTVQCEGDFTEQLPLVKLAADELVKSSGSVILSRDGVTFAIEFDPAIKCEVGEARTIEKIPAKMERVMVRLSGNGVLSYRLRFLSK